MRIDKNHVEKRIKSYDDILIANKVWAQTMLKEDKDYFKRLALGQSPDYLWIGCSDSRVPAAGVSQTEPGELFVHRNIANQIITNDSNIMSVIKYAVDYLKVKHIVVCGHYGCGGVIAAMERNNDEYLGDWLSGIKDSYKKNKAEIMALDDEKQRINRLCEINVERQIEKLALTSIVQHAWDKGQELQLHGWIFDLETGLINPLTEILSNERQ
ncbi:carbonic anhydrase [Saccharicrinis fermentans]|uniref:Carbonic anhydrase 2 n=1 Tax=Saccharicrinis fermentans DSM 9555 = JCM 21142 TaxID=869213 RepID=W7YCX2_9BACT|nr:carbonic anhydrase [Saccharicrinis fermentans]GAF02301.1 carbonic anhydrase 2 [Saccharicrinis fermentans DSM 9555 = JCM 21142]